MRIHALLFVALCAMAMGCGDYEKAEKASPTAAEANVSPGPGSSSKEEKQDAEESKTDDAGDSAEGEVSESSTKEEQPAEVANTPKEMYTSLDKEFNKAMREFQAARAQEKDPVARRKLMMTKMPKPNDFVDGFMAVYEADPGSEFGLKALEWIASRVRTGDAKDKAFELLMKDHPESESLPSLVYGMQRGLPDKSIEEKLKNIAYKGETELLKGVATLTLANFYQNVDRMKNSIDGLRGNVADEVVDYIENKEISTEELLALFGKVKKDYADMKISPRNRQTMGEMAGDAMYVLENLAIGAEAPEIEGEDLEGTAFKLSDYRGKVVVLDFWGDW